MQTNEKCQHSDNLRANLKKKGGGNSAVVFVVVVLLLLFFILMWLPEKVQDQ